MPETPIGSMIVLIAAVFGLIGAGMAFVITYEEWTHHPLPRGEIVKHSLQAAVVTLIFFVVLGVAAGAAFSVALTPH
jgi:hypothetical protein